MHKLFIGYGLTTPLPVKNGGTLCEERVSVAAVYHWWNDYVKENPKSLTPLDTVSYKKGRSCMNVLAC